MEILASYNGLYFHPGSRHCIQSSTVLPAFTQRPWPGTSLGTTHCGHLSVSLWVTALLKTEQSSTSNRPMSLNGPLSLPLSQPSTPPELTSAACQTQLPFGFAHAVPFSQHIFLQTPIVIMPLPPRGSAQTRFCHEGGPNLSSTRWSLCLWPPASHSVTWEPAPRVQFGVPATFNGAPCFSTQQQED